ncbi:3'-5' exoribonuclease [Desulfovibrionales bacterium]
MSLEKRIFTTECRAGQGLEDLFILADARLAQSSNGPFWALTIQDAAGKLDAKIWSPLSQQYSVLPVGAVVLARGLVKSYRDQLQLTIDQLRIIDLKAEGLDYTGLVPTSSEQPEALLGQLEEISREYLVWPPWRKLIYQIFQDPEIRARLLIATGAKSVHHAYVGGLLEHTLSVVQICIATCNYYPQLDREILLTAAILHDLGKAWELTSVPVCDYTTLGRLLGHILIGLEVLEPFLRAYIPDSDLIIHLKHLIVSHHGEYEFGSPRRPKTAEAFVLHYADNLDAKINQLTGVFDDMVRSATKNGNKTRNTNTEDAIVENEPKWSAYQRTLERYLYRPKVTPSPYGRILESSLEMNRVNE